MVSEKFILVSLDDPKSKVLADVLGNKTCKKIVDYLMENNEASEKDVADALKIPLNTVDYNMKKLVASGLVEKRKNFFWSKKGRRIVMYGLSNKFIVISPKRATSEKLKTLLPGFILTVVGSFGVYVYEKTKNAFGGGFSNSQTAVFEKSVGVALEESSVVSDASLNAIGKVNEVIYSAPSNTWLWFLAGGLLVLFVYSLVNWRRL